MDTKNKQDAPYESDRNTEPHREADNSISQNSNVDVSSANATEPDVESATPTGFGDRAQNDERITSFRSNHSGDA